ncbi:MAG: cation transporter [Alphaproteobacteria bacterium]
MGKDCCPAESNANTGSSYRRILWAALVINVLMFGVEIFAGFKSGSSSLMADSIDFFGDAANYGISLFVLGMALSWRAKASLLKGSTMVAFGIWIAGVTVQHALSGTVPEAPVMGAIGLLALIANATVALMLYRYRKGDSNMRSVWICSRNDALGNIAVMLAALGVFGTQSGWPDFIVAGIMATLALSGGIQIIRHAMQELTEIDLKTDKN